MRKTMSVCIRELSIFFSPSHFSKTFESKHRKYATAFSNLQCKWTHFKRWKGEKGDSVGHFKGLSTDSDN